MAIPEVHLFWRTLLPFEIWKIHSKYTWWGSTCVCRLLLPRLRAFSVGWVSWLTKRRLCMTGSNVNYQMFLSQNLGLSGEYWINISRSVECFHNRCKTRPEVYSSTLSQSVYSSFFVHSGNKVANRTMIYLHYGPEKIQNYTIPEADEPKEEIDWN